MFFGTSLRSSLVKSQFGGLSPMNEELQENTPFSGRIKNQSKGNTSFVFLITYTKFGPFLHLPGSSSKIKTHNYTFGYSVNSFGKELMPLFSFSGRFLIIFTDLLNPRILFAWRFKAARGPGEWPREAARNWALYIFLEKIKDGEPPCSRQEISLWRDLQVL